MIDFFRNIFPPRVRPATVEFLVRVFEMLDDPKYAPFIDQLRGGLLRFVGTSRGLPNYLSFTFRPGVSGRYEDKRGRFIRITGISVDCKDRTENVSIYLTHGLVCGMQLEKSLSFTPDLDSIDVSNAMVEYLDFEETIVASALAEEEREFINWADVYEVELDGVVYYHIADIGDGDFVGIDSEGNRFEIRHDPYEVIQRPESLGELISELQKP